MRNDSMISCINCGPCDDRDCLCFKCSHSREKRNKVNRRQERTLARKGKNFSEDEI